MNNPIEQATTFAALHRKGQPLILFNAWDAGSAQAIAKAGAPAIATGSYSVAAAHGFPDGERLSIDLALANLERITSSVPLPVSFDIETGYSQIPEEVAGNVGKAMDAGAIGINIEDGLPGGRGLVAIEAQSARLNAVRRMADQKGVPLFINARTDIFLQADVATHSKDHIGNAIERARAYEQAGASGLFVPGLVDEGLIEDVCERSTLPVNVMVSAGSPGNTRLAELGVARISYGPGPYRLAMAALEEAAREVYS